jgi:papilin
VHVLTNKKINSDSEDHPAQIMELSDTVIGSLGGPVVLRCLAYGSPKPFVQWWHGSTMLPPESQLYERRRDYSLLIRSLTLETLGEYVCHAYNGIGKAGAWTVTVKAVQPINARPSDIDQYRRYLVDSSGEPVVVTPKAQRPHYHYTPAPPPEIPNVYNGLY